MGKVILRALLAGSALAWCQAAVAADGAAGPIDDNAPARLFGAREAVISVSLSPDGQHIALVVPGPDISTRAEVIDVAKGETRVVAAADGKPLNLVSCGWSSNTRLVCKEYGLSTLGAQSHVPFTRTVALSADGSKPLYIGRRAGNDALRASQFDGDIIDWMGGDDASVLMTRDYVPEVQLGSNINKSDDGLGVDLVNTVTGRSVTVEHPQPSASDYLADGQGRVRIRASDRSVDGGMLTGTVTYAYRTAADRSWRTFSEIKSGADGLTPIAVDGTRDVAYAVRKLDGRDALYRVALDGSMKAELVYANPKVDVDEVITIGRHGRVIGATYTTDRREVSYFDPFYANLAAGLARALPKTPLIRFLSASADESRIVVFAGSDVDPGHFYLYDKGSHHLDEIMPARPELATQALAPMQAVSFKARDGTEIPAYLTLPASGQRAGLPAIVLPHGGPAARDEWGFDWLVQYFAARGYAVLQPEFRGSTGYGDAFYAHNGFHSWQTAIGDVCDAGRWLLSQGIAKPGALAVVGWSYGGYAALQANILDPDLFKAVVAVAPVTDLGMLKEEAAGYTNAWLVQQQVGSGDAVIQGSPDRHADRFKAPVLMFHGDGDRNVDVAESRAMDAALRHAGKPSTLVVFPGLDHQLDDADARARMLGQADDFLRSSMKL